MLDSGQTMTDKKSQKIFDAVKGKIPAEILATQSLNVDSVARATLASNGLKLAVARALAKAR